MKSKLGVLLVTAVAFGGPAGGVMRADEARLRRPRMLLAEADAFSGLPALRARYAAGARPSDDMAGQALSWLLTGDEGFAKRALGALPENQSKGRKGSNLYILYVERALAFDWLYAYPGFDAVLKDRVAAELVDGAARMLEKQSLADPSQASYHNHTLREIALASFALTAVAGHASVEGRAAPLREQARAALNNILETTDFVDPEGSYHESMDYMRITFAPLALLAELRRTTTGEDPARSHGVFRSMGPTYLYKVLPDGTTARDDDNEFPHLMSLDNVVLGYAVHRFKDPFAAWMLQRRDWLPEDWDIPVLRFLWDDPTVAPRDPATTTESELPRARLFPGVGHLVLRSGWEQGATWIEYTCGPYFAKHDHLDTNSFAIYHKGHLAIDAGADYTDTESPHYLNQYRRTIAHNSLLVYQPGERFFWSENHWPAANDGGQRMDSSRFWNSVRSREDFRRTRDLWERGRIESYDRELGAYVYARGDGTGAYNPSKLELFQRSLVHLPASDVLFVFDRVRSRNAAFKKVWLLHGVNEPSVVEAVGQAAQAVGQGGTAHANAPLLSFEEGGGRLRVHPLLPREREVVVRGGPGWEFWTPGDEFGGVWGSGKNWPLDPPEGGPLPTDAYLKKMWLTFWGDELGKLAPSNRRAVVPGAWRIEISPHHPSFEDLFLNVLEIGDRGAPPRRIEGIEGHRLAGAVVEGDAVVLFATEPAPLEAEATLPDVGTRFVLIAGLEPRRSYELQLTSNFAPGSPLWRFGGAASDAGLLQIPWQEKDGRLRLRRLAEGAR